jgi:outer membrane protein
MKNFTLGLQAFLVLAVAVLFYLHFSADKTKVGTTSSANNVSSGSFRIAYFEGDSIQTQFDYFKEVQTELQTKAQANSKQLGEMKSIFNTKLQQFQQSAQALSQAEQANKQQELMQLEKAFQGKEKMMSDEFQDEQFKKLQDVKKKIEEYLKTYNKDKGYAFIFNSSPDLMYLKDTVYDITPDVIKGLNDLYKKKK